MFCGVPFLILPLWEKSAPIPFLRLHLLMGSVISLRSKMHNCIVYVNTRRVWSFREDRRSNKCLLSLQLEHRTATPLRERVRGQCICYLFAHLIHLLANLNHQLILAFSCQIYNATLKYMLEIRVGKGCRQRIFLGSVC